MIINRETYDDLRSDLIVARAEATAQKDANSVLQVNLDWFRFRVSQLERERAIFVEKLFGVTVPAPEYVQPENPFKDNPFNHTMGFTDVGDAMARTLGVEHNDEGSLVYTK